MSPTRGKKQKEKRSLQKTPKLMIVDIKIFDPNLVVTRRLPYRQANWNNLKSQRTGKPAHLPSPKGVNPLGQKRAWGRAPKRSLRDPNLQERTQIKIQPLGALNKANPQGRKKAQKGKQRGVWRSWSQTPPLREWRSSIQLEPWPLFKRIRQKIV